MPIAHVIGLGRSGIAAARLLHHHGWHVEVSDTQQTETLTQLQIDLAAQGMTVKLGVRFDLNTLAAQGLSRPDRIVVSPGVPWQLKGLAEARAQGIDMMGEMELAWQYLNHVPWVGITGTNGKTTTTALIAAIFQAAGRRAPACGNIGYSACDLALNAEGLDWVIAEVSSYQIESSSTLAPQIGVWTTLSPDHLARHGTLENYREIKASLLTRSHHQVLNGDDPYLRTHLRSRWPQGCWTSTAGPQGLGDAGQDLTLPAVYIQGGWVKVGDQPMVSVDALRMLGTHNQHNLLMAVAVAHLAGIDASAIETAVRTFPGVPHRLEHIRTWQGIAFINDSKATNYEAGITGLAAVPTPAILIAGGEPKTGDDTEWLQMIQKRAIAVLLIGEAAPRFADRLETIGYRNYAILDTLDQAVVQAADWAKNHQAKAVLLSPACASFDQYRNFEQRGDHFRDLCQQLPT